MNRFFDKIIYRVSKDGQRVYKLSFNRKYDPVTIAVVGTMAAGAIYEGMATSAGAKSQANLSEYNARVQENEANAVEQKAITATRLKAQESARMMGAMRAKASKSGAVITQGSPLLALATQEEENIRENQYVGYEGVVGAQKMRSQAALDRTQAKLYKQKAKTAKTASYIKAGGSMLSGFNYGGAKPGGAPGGGDLAGTSNTRNFTASAWGS